MPSLKQIENMFSSLDYASTVLIITFMGKFYLLVCAPFLLPIQAEWGFSTLEDLFVLGNLWAHEICRVVFWGVDLTNRNHSRVDQKVPTRFVVPPLKCNPFP
jgi:hypothetical protein